MGMLIVALVLLVGWMGIATAYAHDGRKWTYNWKEIIITNTVVSVVVCGVLLAGTLAIVSGSTKSGVNHLRQFDDVHAAKMVDLGVVKEIHLDDITTRFGSVYLTASDFETKIDFDNKKRKMLRNQRDRVYRYRGLQDSFMFGMFWEDLPEYIKPIILVEE